MMAYRETLKRLLTDELRGKETSRGLFEEWGYNGSGALSALILRMISAVISNVVAM